MLRGKNETIQTYSTCTTTIKLGHSAARIRCSERNVSSCAQIICLVMQLVYEKKTATNCAQYGTLRLRNEFRPMTSCGLIKSKLTSTMPTTAAAAQRAKTFQHRLPRALHVCQGQSRHTISIQLPFSLSMTKASLVACTEML